MKSTQQRGSVLLTTMFFILLLTVSAAVVLDMALNSYKLSQRNDLRAKARAVAESELENLYYQVKFMIVASSINPSDIPTQLSSSSYNLADSGTDPRTDRTAFLVAQQADNWIVRRSVAVEQGPVLGTIPNTTKTGTFTYFLIRIEVLPPATSPYAGSVAVRIGRHVYTSTSPIFQYNIFSQGDLEFLPGGPTVIEGDIAANGSIYMAAQNSASASLTISGQVRYLSSGYFNSDSAGDTIYREVGSFNTAAGTTTTVANANLGLKAPLASDGVTALTATSSQLETMDAPENLLGGLDATALAKQYGITSASTYNGLFGNISADPTTAASSYATQLASSENLVYRSMVAPPPSAVYAAAAAATSAQQPGVISAEYPAYSTLSGIGAVTDDPNVSALRAYNKAGLVIAIGADGTTVSVTSNAATINSTIATAVQAAITSATMYDQREGRTVAISQIDVATLKTAIETYMPSTSTTSAFNGLLYVYLANSSSTAPAAVRLVNGSATPNSGTAGGFSVATNGGLYVKGNYNTTTTSGGIYNPAMLMSDAVTVLSSAWTDSTVSTAITSRVATSGTTTIAAGILTGATSATSTSASGGAQNLVRFLEDWYTPSASVRFYGSIGRLFDSTHMTRPFKTGTGVYIQPALRTFAFNNSLKTQTTPGAPQITGFSRGGFFTWSR